MTFGVIDRQLRNPIHEAGTRLLARCMHSRERKEGPFAILKRPSTSHPPSIYYSGPITTHHDLAKVFHDIQEFGDASTMADDRTRIGTSGDSENSPRR